MQDQPTPPPRSDFTMRPAMVVGAIAVVILGAFSVWAAFTKTPTTTKPSHASAKAVAGTGLKAVGAARQLAVIEQAGEPPANVLDDITLPVGALRGSTTDPGSGSTYDQSVQFSVHASQEAVLTFYKAELHDFGWQTVTSGAAQDQAGQQIVGQIAGDDGYYWELGVIVAPSTFSATGTTDITSFTLRLFQVSDESS